MREAGDRTLRLRPLQNRQIPRRPVLDAMRARVILVLEPEKNEVPRVARGKARHFEVVVHQAARLREPMILAGEELLLVVVAGTPGEDRAEVQCLALNLTD